MSEEVWRKPRVLATISMGNTSLYLAIAKGEFPAPVKLGARAVGWRRSEVEAWLASRKTKVA